MMARCSKCTKPTIDASQEHPGVCACGGFITDVKVNICVPVLKRYDLLRRMVQSCQAGNTKPDAYYIIDNGRNSQKLMAALGDFDIDAKVHTPPVPKGIAESWNWFIDKVPEERIITNDDIEFAPNSLELLVASEADLIWAGGCGFSCFVLRDACVQKLGRFDEEISPGYGYYEDDDYLQRLDGRGTKPRNATAEEVQAGVIHHRSSTLEVATHAELMEHHRKFKIAQTNYARKWGLEKEFGHEPGTAGNPDQSGVEAEPRSGHLGYPGRSLAPARSGRP